MKLIRPKWDFNFLKCGTPVPDFHLTTSKVSEAWLSHPVLRTTLLCWILKGDKGWKRRKNSGDGKGPRDRAVEQSRYNVKLQTCQNKASSVFYDYSMTLYNVSRILDKNLLAIDGNWIVDSQVAEIPSLLGVQHSLFRCWGNLSTKHLGLTMPHWRGLSLHGPSYAWQFAANAWLLNWHHKPDILGPHKSASCVGGRLKMPCQHVSKCMKCILFNMTHAKMWVLP